MKKIEAIIREEKLSEVKDALEKAGFISITVYSVKGRGAQKGVLLEWRAGTYRVDLLPKIMLMLVVKDEDYKKAVDIIVNVCNSDSNGDGKIFITTVDEVIRVRTGEQNELAI